MTTKRTQFRALLTAASLAALVTAGCAAEQRPTTDSTTDPTTPASSATTEPVDNAPPEDVCFNPHGGECLGELDAGTYRTEVFRPQLRYTVPKGWVNAEDLPGNFLLYRRGDSQEGLIGGSYLGIYAGVRVPDGCIEAWDNGVGDAPPQLLQWYVDHPGLDVTSQRRVSVGGLEGIAIDLKLTRGYSGSCPFSAGMPVVPLIIGNGVSDLHHVLLEELRARLILLEWKKSNVTIEITSRLDQHSFADYMKLTDPIIASLRFSG